MSHRLRSPVAALGVGALLGLVVAGAGSRVAMRVIALADDKEDFGLPTEGGDTIGEVTLQGTASLLLTGVMLGIAGAFAYLALRRWLPERPLVRTLCFALIILGFGLTATQHALLTLLCLPLAWLCTWIIFLESGEGVDGAG